MKKYLNILQKCILFDGISDSNLISMLSCLHPTVKQYQKNATVIAEGEKAQYIGIVLSGSVQVEKIDYYGNRSIVSLITPSEIFAETFACANLPSIPVTVTASENCQIMFVDCMKVINTCSNSCQFHRQIIFNLIKVIAAKNLYFHQKIEITSQKTTREKLLTYLFNQAKTKGNSFQIPYSRQELADYLGVDRSGLSTEIGKLKRDGIIDCHKNRFTLL